MSPAGGRARPGGDCSGRAPSGKGGGRAAPPGSAGAGARAGFCGADRGLRGAGDPGRRPLSSGLPQSPAPARLSLARSCGPAPRSGPGRHALGSAGATPPDWHAAAHPLPDAPEAWGLVPATLAEALTLAVPRCFPRESGGNVSPFGQGCCQAV